MRSKDDDATVSDCSWMRNLAGPCCLFLPCNQKKTERKNTRKEKKRKNNLPKEKTKTERRKRNKKKDNEIEEANDDDYEVQ